MPLAIRLLGATWRLRIHGGDVVWRGRGAVFPFWHGHILPLAYAFRGSGVKILISLSRDGEVIARAVRRLGFGAVRGSSSRGGAKAVLAMLGELSRGGRIGITPDGPRGPGYVVKDGLVSLARKSGAWIFPVLVRAKPAVRLKSWDRFVIPLPFARVDVYVRDGMRFSESDDEEYVLRRLQEALSVPDEL